jgi:hypothetical protein
MMGESSRTDQTSQLKVLRSVCTVCMRVWMYVPYGCMYYVPFLTTHVCIMCDPGTEFTRLPRFRERVPRILGNNTEVLVRKRSVL